MEFEAIKKIINEQLGADTDGLTLETSFEDLKVDSLDMVEIVMAIEDEFDIVIEGNDNIKTVGDVVNYIENLN